MQNEKKWKPGGNAREGLESSPWKGFAWCLDPCLEISTEESGKFTYSLAAGGIQHKVAKLFSAIKECLLTFCNLF